MPTINLGERPFYEDLAIKTHSIRDNQNGRYFLNIEKGQYQNFELFLAMQKIDSSRIGISATSDERIQRKDFLQKIEKINEFIKSLNSGTVYSRVNTLYELPVNELRNCLDENKPFDLNKYKLIAANIENIINENAKRIFSANVKNESIEQTIMLISQKEPDKDFINWLKINLTPQNQYKDLKELKEDYLITKISMDISEFREIKNPKETFIIGKAVNNQTFDVKIPKQYNMNQFFNMYFEKMDKSHLINLDPKLVAKYVFGDIIKNNPYQVMEEPKNIIPPIFKNDDPNILLDPKNNIIVNTKSGEIEQINNGIVEKPEVNKYDYNTSSERPLEDPTEVQAYEQSVISNLNPIPSPQMGLPNNLINTPEAIEPSLTKNAGKKRVLIPPKNFGFIKIGTIILFGLSFLLTIVSLILIIVS